MLITVKIFLDHVKTLCSLIRSQKVCVCVCHFHLWMSCWVFCMDVMEASIRAMSFTSLLHFAHWFGYPGHMNLQIKILFVVQLVCALCGTVCITFIVRGLVRWFWCGAAALGVLAAAGRLAAGLPVFPVHLRLRGSTRHSMKVVQTALQTNWPQAGSFNTPTFRKISVLAFWRHRGRR